MIRYLLGWLHLGRRDTPGVPQEPPHTAVHIAQHRDVADADTGLVPVPAIGRATIPAAVQLQVLPGPRRARTGTALRGTGPVLRAGRHTARAQCVARRTREHEARTAALASEPLTRWMAAIRPTPLDDRGAVDAERFRIAPYIAQWWEAQERRRAAEMSAARYDRALGDTGEFDLSALDAMLAGQSAGAR